MRITIRQFRPSSRNSHLSWLLIVAFLFQSAMPALAQIRFSPLESNVQFALCTLQAENQARLNRESENQDEIPASSQLCPACLLSHLVQSALPGSGGLNLPQTSWQASWNTFNDFQNDYPVPSSVTPIRAPPFI